MKTIHHLLLILAALLLMAGQTAEAQSFPDYSEHSFWSDSYPIYDAVNYRGKLYAVQNYRNVNKDVRLIEFSVDPSSGTLKDERYWTLDWINYSFLNYRDIKLVAYRDAIYIFQACIYEDKAQWKITSFRLKPDNTAEIKDLPYPSNLAGENNYEMYPGIGGTVYKNRLCMFYISQKDNQLYMLSTDRPEDSGSWTKTPTINQKIYQQKMLDQDTWDVCTWFGKVDGAMTEKLVVGLIAGRNLWAYTFDGEPAASEPGQWTADHYFNGTPDFGSFSLKLVQGSISNFGSDKTTLKNDTPLQFIYAVKKNLSLIHI